MKKTAISLLFIALIICSSVFTLNLMAVNAQTSSTVTINNGALYTNSTAVKLKLSATNSAQMCFSNDNSAWSSWETYATTKNWTITNVEGTKTVYVQFRDSGNLTSTANAKIILDVTPPVLDPYWTPYSADYKTVYFDASYSTDNYGIANATWNLGDGNITYNYAYFTHTYASIGNYLVTLTLIDNAGNSASATMNVTVPDASTIATPTPTPTPIPSYSITITHVGSGTVSPTDGLHTVASPVTLSATASTNYVFMCWLQNGTFLSSSNPYSYSPTNNYVITAVFYDPVAKETPTPTANPTSNPTQPPTSSPTTQPSSNPATNPTNNPTTSPTQNPTLAPTPTPTAPELPAIVLLSMLVLVLISVVAVKLKKQANKS